MHNILVLHESEQPTLIGIYDALTKFGLIYECKVTKEYATKVSLQQLLDTDVIIIVRGESPMVYAILKFANAIGKYTVYFLDDDLKDMPKNSFRYPRRKWWLLDSIRQCRVLYSTSHLIAEEYEEFVIEKRTAVTNTAVSPEDITLTLPNSVIIKLVYAASEWHEKNFNTFIKPILQSLFEVYGKKIELHFIGLHPEIDVGEYNSQIFYVASMPMDRYDEYMRTNHFDIGLAPLVTNHFTERKYFNKYIEYTKFGICGIYSDVMPYRLVVKDGWNGYLSENTPEAWLESIRRLINDREARDHIIKTAQEHLLTEHSEMSIFHKLKTDIPELVFYNAPEIQAKWPTYMYFYRIRHVLFRMCEMIYLTAYSLNHFGFSKTLEKIKRKVR